MTNDAAERLRIGLHNASPDNFAYIRSVARYDLDQALAAADQAGYEEGYKAGLKRGATLLHDHVVERLDRPGNRANLDAEAER